MLPPIMNDRTEEAQRECGQSDQPPECSSDKWLESIELVFHMAALLFECFYRVFPLDNPVGSIKKVTPTSAIGSFCRAG